MSFLGQKQWYICIQNSQPTTIILRNFADGIDCQVSSSYLNAINKLVFDSITKKTANNRNKNTVNNDIFCQLSVKQCLISLINRMYHQYITNNNKLKNKKDNKFKYREFTLLPLKDKKWHYSELIDFFEFVKKWKFVKNNAYPLKIKKNQNNQNNDDHDEKKTRFERNEAFQLRSINGWIDYYASNKQINDEYHITYTMKYILRFCDKYMFEIITKRTSQFDKNDHKTKYLIFYDKNLNFNYNNMNLECDIMCQDRFEESKFWNSIITNKYYNIVRCCNDDDDDSIECLDNNLKLDLFCWGNFEFEIISALLKQNIKYFKTVNKCICDLIASYCTNGNVNNIDSIFKEYSKQIEMCHA